MEVNAKAGVLSFSRSRKYLEIGWERERRLRKVAEKLPGISKIKRHRSTARDGMTDIDQMFWSQVKNY